jgi:hypothetical protein
MSHLLDIVAFAIVLFCVAYALRTLLPRTVLVHITGKSGADKKSGCGGCDGGCNNVSKTTDSGCH